MTLLRTGALAIAALALAGCMTIAYGPIDAPKSSGFGYRDHPNNDGSHTILVVGSTSEQAYEFWDRRANELCGGPHFQRNIFRAQRPVVTTYGYASNPMNPAMGGSYSQDAYGGFFLEGYVRCDAEAPAVTTPAADAPPPASAPQTPPSG